MNARVILSSGDRSALLRGAVMLLLVLLVGRGAPAYRRWRTDVRNQRDLAVARATYVSASVRDIQHSRARLADAARRLAAYDSAYVAGATATAAGAALAELISEAATDADVQLTSIQASADSLPSGPARRVHARASVSGDFPKLARFIESLEEGMPLVAVRTVDITQAGSPTPDRPEQLRADLEIESVARAIQGKQNQ